MSVDTTFALPYFDRREAGRVLARALADHRDRPAPIVLALPRGGVPVGFEVARALGAPLDVFVVRKLGLPSQPELAMGAIASGGVRVLNREVLAATAVTQDVIERVTADEGRELRRREALYRGNRGRLDVSGRTVFVVDDGLATGTTMRAACMALGRLHPREIIVAVPVGPSDVRDDLFEVADDVVCVATPSPFFAVGQWYQEFAQTTDDEVRSLLDEAAAPIVASSTDVCVPVTDEVRLEGTLVVPQAASGLVLFAHGSGSSRFSPRNRRVAQRLQEVGLGTLLLDLLSPSEEREDAYTAHLRFDVGLLASRLVAAIDWVGCAPQTKGLRVGCFGASTGAAAALVAAAQRPAKVRAVVSRGGRPDLAGAWLQAVRCPTLLVVGGDDHEVIGLNQDAQTHLLGCDSKLEIVAGATHLFEEPGTLERVADLAAAWFSRFLTTAEQPSEPGQTPVRPPTDR